MPTLYMTEPARSGRGKCKKSKEPIAKGEVRVGKGYEKDDHVMWGWYKPAFFPLPKKELKEHGGDVRAWVAAKVSGFHDLSEDQQAALLADLEKPRVKGGGAAGNSFEDKQKRKFEVMAAAVGASPAQKKTKLKKKRGGTKYDITVSEPSSSGAAASSKNEVPYSSSELAEMEVYLKYNAMSKVAMSQICYWNRQPKSAKSKKEMITRCMQGEIYGALPLCPECGATQGKNATSLKRDPETLNITCSGYFDEAAGGRVPCYFSRPQGPPAGQPGSFLLPWVTNETGSRAQTEDELEAAKAGRKGNAAAEEELSSIKFVCPAGTTPRDAVGGILGECDRIGVCIPKDSRGPSVGAVYMTMKDPVTNACDVRKVVEALIAKYGTEKAKASAKSARAAQCLVPANAPLAAAFEEMGNLIKQKGEPPYKFTSCFLAAHTIRKWPEEIKDGGTLTKGKQKVKGLGKSTGEKMNEFLQTGTIEKLERLRNE